MAASAVTSGREDAPLGFWDIVKKMFLCFTYILVSSALIRFNKYMMHEERFPFSLTLSAIHMLMATICCGATYMVAPGLMPKMAETRGHRLELMKWFLPIGACFAVMLFGSNEAYKHSSVTFLQFMKEANVMVVFLISCVVGLQVLNRSRAVVIMWVILGASISIHGEIQFSMIGFALQAVSQVAECCRMVMGECVLCGPRKLDPLTYTMFVAPICLFILIIANCFQWHPETLSRMVEWWPALLANASVAFALNVLVAMVIKECSAVGFVLTGLLKDIVIVVLSSLFFGEHVTALQAGAFVITIAGVGFWSLMKISPQAAPVQMLETLLCVPKADQVGALTLNEHTTLLGKKAIIEGKQREV